MRQQPSPALALFLAFSTADRLAARALRVPPQGGPLALHANNHTGLLKQPPLGSALACSTNLLITEPVIQKGRPRALPIASQQATGKPSSLSPGKQHVHAR